jgi:hypothetical protein
MTTCQAWVCLGQKNQCRIVDDDWRGHVVETTVTKYNKYT